MAEDGNDHFGAVDETTKRLVGRCGRVSWLKEEQESPGSPAKLKQNLLSVSMPGAMESSLSVMEVAAQKSRPGIKTPSRAAYENRRDGETGEVPEDARNPVEGREGEGDSSRLVSGDDGVVRVMSIPKSPFEVEGEA